MISDIPEDYLTLYAGAREVHSSRVHACVAAISYGVPARFYSDTPRGLLFDMVGASAIRDRLVSLDASALESKKQAQLECVRRIVSSSFPALTTDGWLTSAS